MLTGINEPILDYIRVDMESIYFKDITYEDRSKAIQYFQKFNKPVCFECFSGYFATNWSSSNSYTQFRVNIEKVNNKWKVTKVDILK